MTDVKALIRSARLPEHEVPLCLRADLVAEYERFSQKLEKARAATGDSLAGPGERVAAIEERLADVREQMVGSTLTVTLRALPSHRYQQLLDAHPPRTSDGVVEPRDRVGFNTETFFPALARACVVAPDLDDEDWDALVGDDGKLTDGQVSKLCNTAWNLNRKDVDLPF